MDLVSPTIRLSTFWLYLATGKQIHAGHAAMFWRHPCSNGHVCDISRFESSFRFLPVLIANGKTVQRIHKSSFDYLINHHTSLALDLIRSLKRISKHSGTAIGAAFPTLVIFSITFILGSQIAHHRQHLLPFLFTYLTSANLMILKQELSVFPAK